MFYTWKACRTKVHAGSNPVLSALSFPTRNQSIKVKLGATLLAPFFYDYTTYYTIFAYFDLLKLYTPLYTLVSYL